MPAIAMLDQDRLVRLPGVSIVVIFVVSRLAVSMRECRHLQKLIITSTAQMAFETNIELVLLGSGPAVQWIRQWSAETRGDAVHDACRHQLHTFVLDQET